MFCRKAGSNAGPSLLLDLAISQYGPSSMLQDVQANVIAYLARTCFFLAQHCLIFLDKHIILEPASLSGGKKIWCWASLIVLAN